MLSLLQRLSMFLMILPQLLRSLHTFDWHFLLARCAFVFTSVVSTFFDTNFRQKRSRQFFSVMKIFDSYVLLLRYSIELATPYFKIWQDVWPCLMLKVVRFEKEARFLTQAAATGLNAPACLCTETRDGSSRTGGCGAVLNLPTSNITSFLNHTFISVSQ